MLRALQNTLQAAEEEYDDIYQIECAFKDDYSYRRINRAQADVRRAERKLAEFYLLKKVIRHDAIIERIMGYM